MNKTHTASSYVIGFVLSLLLTVGSYVLVVYHVSFFPLVGMLVFLALIQLFVQLFFFLHLGQEAKPQWNLLIFLMTLLILGIILGGTLWIMHNLSYHMTPREIHQYMQNQSGI